MMDGYTKGPAPIRRGGTALRRVGKVESHKGATRKAAETKNTTDELAVKRSARIGQTACRCRAHRQAGETIRGRCQTYRGVAATLRSRSHSLTLDSLKIAVLALCVIRRLNRVQTEAPPTSTYFPQYSPLSLNSSQYTMPVPTPFPCDSPGSSSPPPCCTSPLAHSRATTSA